MLCIRYKWEMPMSGYRSNRQSLGGLGAIALCATLGILYFAGKYGYELVIWICSLF